MNRQFTPKLLLLFLIGFAFNFCSDPVKVGEDTQDNVTISNIVINNVVDNDADDFYAAVNLSFTINTENNMNLRAYVGYKGTEDTEYQAYSYYFTFDANGTEGISITLDSEDHPFSSGCYDFIIWIYEETDTDLENLLASISASEDEDLYLCMESYDDDQPTIQLIFNNECPTSVMATITSYGSLTIPANSTNSYTFYSDPGTITFNASTQISIGQNLVWTNRTVDLTGLQSYTYRLFYSEAIFYATVTNSGASTINQFIINKGLDDEYSANISIPNNGVATSLGYYNAHGTDTEVWFWSTGAQAWYYWYNLVFPGGDNQVVNLSSDLPQFTGTNSPDIREFFKKSSTIEAK